MGSRLPPEVMLVSEDHASTGDIPIWVACAVTWVHGDVWAHDAAEGHVSDCGCTTARFCVDICGLLLPRGSMWIMCIEIQALYWEVPALCWPWEIWLCPSLTAAGVVLALYLIRELASPLTGPDDPALRELAQHSGQLAPHLTTAKGWLTVMLWVQESWPCSSLDRGGPSRSLAWPTELHPGPHPVLWIGTTQHLLHLWPAAARGRTGPVN